MKILVVQRDSLVAGVNFSLSVYARVVEAMDWLRDQGKIQYAVCGENEEAIFPALRWADAVIFNKHISAGAVRIAEEARKRGLRTLLDFDDLVTAFPAYSAGADEHEKFFPGEMLGLMDVVTVANARLRKEISPLRDDCVLVPNGIYAEKYPKPVMEEASPPRCVFTNADYLKIDRFRRGFTRVLQDFHQLHPEITFDFFGDAFPELLSLPFIHYTRRIPYSEYINCLARTGYCFAITPLGGKEDAANLRFNRCKNPFKFLNYGIAGIPAVYSSTDIYDECIDNGVTGLIAKNDYASWMEKLEYMYADANFRRKIKYTSYNCIYAKYHIRESANKFFDLI
ncbi:MAG: glycosyltransferase [Deltaproteobacteria bacterium]|jgi:glycosyltransferase involved in cell wall biosynthesis|nr:glycosyltransferase [Deltaproteobacteria bacterium]